MGLNVVILWVDDGDKEWVRKRNGWAEREGLPSIPHERYRNWDNLKYIFRGIEKFIPWVNKVHLVSYDQIPHWLDISHEKLNLVSHKEKIPEEFLPTFSSHSIELNIHKIKGLANNFIYFNDDMFVTKKTNENFFHK